MKVNICSNRINFFKTIMFIIPILVILFICVYNIPNNKMIKIVGDEYGYWAAGSFFAGLDWTSITSINSYYGYGYGVFLALILKVTSSQITAYQVAIILNGIMLSGCYVIAIKTIRDVVHEIEWYVQIVFAFTITMYTSNIYYVQYTLSETLLLFLYWIIIYCAVQLLKKITFKRIVLFLFVAFYSVTVHMRMIGVLIVCVLFIIYLLWREKKSMYIWFAFGGVLLILALVCIEIKTVYQLNYFDGGNGINLENNEVSGQIGKVAYFLSLEGVISFVKGFIGKVFYALSSTYLLFGIAVIQIIKSVFTNLSTIIKEKKSIAELSNINIIGIFMLLSVLFAIAICDMFMINYGGRFDGLTYARYFENVLSPLLLYALYYLYISVKDKRTHCILLISYVVIGILTNEYQNYSLPTTHTFLSTVGIAKNLIKMKHSENTFLFILLKVIIVYLILVLVTFINKQMLKKSFGLFCIIMIVFNWINTSQFVYTKGCLSWSLECVNDEIELFEYITNNDIQDKLYYCYEENAIKADMLQFLLKNNAINCIQKHEIKDLSGQEYLLTPTRTQTEQYINEQKYILLKESQNLKLWKKY